MRITEKIKYKVLQTTYGHGKKKRKVLSKEVEEMVDEMEKYLDTSIGVLLEPKKKKRRR